MNNTISSQKKINPNWQAKISETDGISSKEVNVQFLDGQGSIEHDAYMNNIDSTQRANL